MTETLEVRPGIGTEAWIRQSNINILMDQGWHFRVSGYNEGYCKVEIVGRSTGFGEEEEEEEEEETTFETKVCEICGKEFSPEDYETETSAGKALGGHKTSHRRESDNGGEEEEEEEEQTGLNELFPEREEEAEA